MRGRTTMKNSSNIYKFSPVRGFLTHLSCSPVMSHGDFLVPRLKFLTRNIIFWLPKTLQAAQGCYEEWKTYLQRCNARTKKETMLSSNFISLYETICISAVLFSKPMILKLNLSYRRPPVNKTSGQNLFTRRQKRKDKDKYVTLENFIV